MTITVIILFYLRKYTKYTRSARLHARRAGRARKKINNTPTHQTRAFISLSIVLHRAAGLWCVGLRSFFQTSNANISRSNCDRQLFFFNTNVLTNTTM